MYDVLNHIIIHHIYIW